MEIEYREFEIRDVDDDARTVSGLAVPYNQTASVGDRQERFEPNAFDASAAVGQPLFYGHDHKAGGLPIGKITQARNSDDGLHITAALSRTAKGDEVHQLLKDGVVRRFSVGFNPQKQSNVDGVTVRSKAELKELSVTPFPAYSGAQVTEVREENNNKESNDNKMENEELKNEVTELRESVTTLQRRVADQEVAHVTEASPIKARSLGEFVKGIFTGETSQAETQAVREALETRTYTGDTSADNGGRLPTWIQRDILLPVQSRQFLNLWNKQDLPSNGMTIEYPVLGSATNNFGQQVNEGDALGYNKLTTTVASATVKTYAGGASVSRQLLERSDPQYIETLLKYMGSNYASVTNSAVRSAVVAGATGTGSVTHTSAASWLSAVATAAGSIAGLNIGLTADFAVMSTALFVELAAVADTTGRPMFVVNGDGQNTVGGANVTGLRGNIAGLPVVVDPNMSGTSTFYIASSQAATVLESAGAPYTLTFDDITTLVHDISVYGYLTTTINVPAAIVAVTVS